MEDNNITQIKDTELYYFFGHGNAFTLMNKLDEDAVENMFGIAVVKSAYKEIEGKVYYDSYENKNEYQIYSSILGERLEFKLLNDVIDYLYDNLDSFMDENRHNFDTSYGDIFLELYNDKLIRVNTSEWGSIDNVRFSEDIHV
jgi:negative regulator of sigma E activity